MKKKPTPKRLAKIFGSKLKKKRSSGSAEARCCAAPFQSKRRELRNSYAAIRMGLENPRDARLGMRALKWLITRNEIEIAKEEARHNGKVRGGA